MELINKMEAVLSEIKERGGKFYEKGNSTAGTDARKSALSLQRLCKELRDDISRVKNERKK